MKKLFLITLSIIFLLTISGCSEVKVFEFPKDKVQSFNVYTYDTKSNTTTNNWVYQDKDMADFLDYLENLSGVKVDSFDTSALSSPFYGIELSVDNPYPLLIIGDYAINYEGQYYKINSKKAEEMCKFILGDTKVYDGLSYIMNHRYLSLLDGKWDTTYMTKSSWTQDPLANATMSAAEASINTSFEKLEIVIENSTGSTMEFGSRLILEALVGDVWYNIDDMINDNLNLGWTDELRILTTGESTEDSFYLAYYQPLPAGSYRLVKEVRVNDSNGYLACVFEVE